MTLVIGIVIGWILDNVLPYHYAEWQDRRRENRAALDQWYRDAAELGRRIQSIWSYPMENHVQVDSETHERLRGIISDLNELRYRTEGIPEDHIDIVDSLTDVCNELDDPMEMYADESGALLSLSNDLDGDFAVMQENVQEVVDLGEELEEISASMI